MALSGTKMVCKALYLTGSRTTLGEANGGTRSWKLNDLPGNFYLRLKVTALNVFFQMSEKSLRMPRVILDCQFDVHSFYHSNVLQMTRKQSWSCPALWKCWHTLPKQRPASKWVHLRTGTQKEKPLTKQGSRLPYGIHMSQGSLQPHASVYLS